MALYLDHNATTPLDPVVLEAMRPFLTVHYANPSATHEPGRSARRSIDKAREQVAAALNADASEVIFTSSGSEANNLLIQGVARAVREDWSGEISLGCSQIEHPCVLEPMRAMSRQGFGLTEMHVDTNGVLSVDTVSELSASTKLVSVMSANNETGVIQPVVDLANGFRASHNGYFHTDAVQALGKQPLSFCQLKDAGVSALTVSAHKVGGPKGAAALLRVRSLPMQPLIYGGGQEDGLRSGTENVAAIVGFGLACERAVSALDLRIQRARACKELLESGLRQRGAIIFGEAASRLPNTTYAAFSGIDGETLVSLLDREQVAISSGAACGSGKAGISAVLSAMGVDPLLAKGAIRVSLGMMPDAATDRLEVEQFLLQLDVVLGQLRRFAAVA